MHQTLHKRRLREGQHTSSQARARKPNMSNATHVKVSQRYYTTMAWYDTLQARYYTLTVWYKRFPVLANTDTTKLPLNNTNKCLV